MNKEELIKKLRIGALSEEDQTEYLAKLYEVAAKRAGLRMTLEMDETQLKQSVETALAADPENGLDNFLTTAISDEEQIRIISEEFDKLVSQIADDVADSLKRLG